MNGKSMSGCVRLPQIIGMQKHADDAMSAVAHVTITLHSVRTYEYCPPPHICHLFVRARNAQHKAESKQFCPR